METPWIKTIHQQSPIQPDGTHGPLLWHAIFARKVILRRGAEWVTLKWGFNSAVLLDEALERAKLFIESQHSLDGENNRGNRNNRTLALRFKITPGEGLGLAILGKVCAETEAAARKAAEIYCREIGSVFPYDFVTQQANNAEEYVKFSGEGSLLAYTNKNIVQIKRFERFLPSQEGMQYVHGLWRSGPRAHEQIWRSLALLDYPALFTITLRPVMVFPFEQHLFQEYKAPKKNLEPIHTEQVYPISYSSWMDSFASRRDSPTRKYFYLQTHLISPDNIDENITRSIGTALTREYDGKPNPGYQVLIPNPETGAVWIEYINRLDPTPPESHYPPAHLSDIADIEEAVEVFRYPYPHEIGIPNVPFETAPAPSSEPPLQDNPIM